MNFKIQVANEAEKIQEYITMRIPQEFFFSQSK